MNFQVGYTLQWTNQRKDPLENAQSSLDKDPHCLRRGSLLLLAKIMVSFDKDPHYVCQGS